METDFFKLLQIASNSGFWQEKIIILTQFWPNIKILLQEIFIFIWNFRVVSIIRYRFAAFFRADPSLDLDENFGKLVLRRYSMDFDKF